MSTPASLQQHHQKVRVVVQQLIQSKQRKAIKDADDNATDVMPNLKNHLAWM
jgi:hypothetical protein